MKTIVTRFQPEEILQIIRANYKQQQQFDDIALKNQELTFDTTIFDWRDICDLVDASELWKYLNYYFDLDASRETWMEILEPDDEKTLRDLCKFVAGTAEKEVIVPIKIMGGFCSTAAIFKSLKKRLEERGLDVSDIQPSTKLEPLVKKYKSVLIQEINQIDPSVLPPVNFKTNWIYKWGLRVLLSCIFVTVFLAYRKSDWGWVTGAIGLLGFCMIWLGAWLKPKEASFKDINTVADLVRKIDQQKTRSQ